jgi:tripartite-type tricarboxylate transporter receptor subunit TctC
LNDPLNASLIPPISAGGYIKAGHLRALAVTSATRSGALPGILTVGDFVPGYEASQWYGVGAPRNTPAAIVETLNKEINAGLAKRHPACRRREAQSGSRTERENLAGDAKGKCTSGSNREAESTDAPERGGLPRSSDEAG